MKRLTDKYETDELHIPNMFQGAIKVCYLTVITILSLIAILLWIFLRDPFSKPHKIYKSTWKFETKITA
jgi:hypothetical protein